MPLPENALALAVYDRCGDEWLTDGWGGRLAIPGTAIESAMRVLRITNAHDRGVVYDDVKTISRTIAAEQAKEQERKRDATTEN